MLRLTVFPRLAAIVLTTIIAGAVFSSAAEAAKECKPGHWHYGASNGAFKGKKVAMRDAIRSWASFTDFEYGSAWAFFRLAADKSSKCEKEVGNRWRCSVEGRPCKRVRGGKRRRK